MFEIASKRGALLAFYIFSISIFSFGANLSVGKAIEGFRFDQMEFYPIGWSKQGSFAYGTLARDKKGHSIFKWYIQDLIEDKNLFSSPEIYLLKDQSVHSLWQKHPEWSAPLIRYAIEEQTEFNWGGKSFQIGASRFSILSSITRPESIQSPLGKTGAISITLIKDQLSKKQVYTYSFLPGKMVIDDIIVKGYLKSPYEKRIAIVYLERVKAKDEEFLWHYGVTGAHLNIGFSKILIKKSDLIDAVFNGQNFLLKRMLQAGASVNELDSRGYPPLIIASRLSRWSTVRILLQYDADVHIKDNEGHTALYYAEKANQKEIEHLLKAKGARS